MLRSAKHAQDDFRRGVCRPRCWSAQHLPCQRGESAHGGPGSDQDQHAERGVRPGRAAVRPAQSPAACREGTAQADREAGRERRDAVQECERTRRAGSGRRLRGVRLDACPGAHLQQPGRGARCRVATSRADRVAQRRDREPPLCRAATDHRPARAEAHRTRHRAVAGTVLPGSEHDQLAHQARAGHPRRAHRRAAGRGGHVRRWQRRPCSRPVADQHSRREGRLVCLPAARLHLRFRQHGSVRGWFRLLGPDVRGLAVRGRHPPARHLRGVGGATAHFTIGLADRRPADLQRHRARGHVRRTRDDHRRATYRCMGRADTHG